MTMLRRSAQSSLLLLLLALAGCGPGVGGTGTGEGYALDFFGARAASVCTASFASELKCPSRIVIGPARVDLSEGSQPVRWVDDPAVPAVAARIEGSEIDFEASCEGVRFAGTWGTTEGGTGRFFGHFTVPGLDVASPGTLSVQDDGNGLSLVIKDAREAIVFGPVALQRADSSSQATSCQVQSASPLLGVKYR